MASFKNQRACYTIFCNYVCFIVNFDTYRLTYTLSNHFENFQTFWEQNSENRKGNWQEEVGQSIYEYEKWLEDIL